MRRLLWRLKWTIKAITPPILILGGKRALGVRTRPPAEPEGQTPAGGLTPEEPPEWEYVPEGWARPAKGWDVEAVARAYRDKWPAYLAAIEAPNPLGVHYETAQVTTGDVSAHNMLVAFAYVVALAARDRDRLSVLDWGGGLGHYWALARLVVPGRELEYHVKETPAVCAHGREVAPEVTFHEDESCLARTYDLVDTEYLGWVLNRHEFLAYAAGAGISLGREFLLDARFSAAGAPESPLEHRSFLFNR